MNSPRVTLSTSQRFVLFVAASVALASGGCAFFGEGINVELNQDQLQRIVDAMFPLDNAEEASNLTVALSQPTVTIPDGGDRIGFALDIAVTVVLEPGEGPVAERAQERQEERQAEQEETQATEPEGRGGRAKDRSIPPSQTRCACATARREPIRHDRDLASKRFRHRTSTAFLAQRGGPCAYDIRRGLLSLLRAQENARISDPAGNRGTCQKSQPQAARIDRGCRNARRSPLAHLS